MGKQLADGDVSTHEIGKIRGDAVVEPDASLLDVGTVLGGEVKNGDELAVILPRTDGDTAVRPAGSSVNAAGRPVSLRISSRSCSVVPSISSTVKLPSVSAVTFVPFTLIVAASGLPSNDSTWPRS